jgi:hypothetical protein
MVIVALLAGLFLWFTLDKKSLRDRRLWPGIVMGLLGVILLAKGHPFIGMALIGGVYLGARFLGKQGAPQRPAIEPRELIDARDLLGVTPEADRDTVVAAHRRLIARNHPDNGGTAGLAARLNAARDVLLKHQCP